MVETSREEFSEAPLVIGEAGIPFNFEGGRAYRTGDFTQQVRALDDVLQALEASGANFQLEAARQITTRLATAGTGRIFRCSAGPADGNG